MRCSTSPANRLLRVDPPTVRNWTVIQMPFLRIGEEVGRMSSGSRGAGLPQRGNRRSQHGVPPQARHCEEPVQGCDEVQSRQGTESTLRRSALLLLLVFTGSIHAETWMGLEVEPENRCSAYNRDPGLSGTPNRWSRR